MAKKILIIDDDKSILDSVTLVLSDAGYEVDSVFRGEEALAKVADFNPSVILLDVLMSGKDGREICRKIKSDDKTRRIPVIMISAHPTAAKSSTEVGANDFIAKPFELEELLSKIKKYTHNA